MHFHNPVFRKKYLIQKISELVSFHFILFQISTDSFRRSLNIKTGVSIGGACGVIVIVVGNGHGDTSSNPGRD